LKLALVNKLKRIFFFVAPILTYLFFIAVFISLFRRYYEIIGGCMLAYFLPPAGKESVIPVMMVLLRNAGCGEIESVLLPVTIIVVTDMISAAFIILNFDLLNFIPKLGDVIKKIEEKAEKFILEYKIEKNVYFSLFIFMFVPFQGTGSTMTSIIGKLLSLDSFKLFLIILFASLSSALFVATVSNVLSQYFKNTFFGILAAILVIVLLGSLIKILKKHH